jgi:hypothetical protein
MKNLFLVVFISFIGLSTFAQEVLVSAPVATATEAAFNWEDGLSYDFGKIPQNQPASHKFVFTNTGSEPLLISSAKGSCGCTVTEYSTEPIAPGAKGMVLATYNAKKAGVFSKTVTVYANAGDPVILKVRGEVVATTNE